jgi:hypothetical protein
VFFDTIRNREMGSGLVPAVAKSTAAERGGCIAEFSPDAFTISSKEVFASSASSMSNPNSRVRFEATSNGIFAPRSIRWIKGNRRTWRTANS